MIYVGIDIAKQKHFAAAMTADGEVLIQPFGFSNDSEGFSLLASKLNPLDKEDLLIGLESTSHYGENLICYLYNMGYHIAVINPIQTATLRKSNIRKTKTDKVDTFLIIKSMILNNHRIFTQADIDSIRLKSLCRFREKTKKAKARLKIQLVSYVDITFPELQYFFKSGIHINTSYELLKKHSNPNDIAALHLTYLGNLLKKASHGRFGKEEAIAFINLVSILADVDNEFAKEEKVLLKEYKEELEIEEYMHQKIVILKSHIQLMVNQWEQHWTVQRI